MTISPGTVPLLLAHHKLAVQFINETATVADEFCVSPDNPIAQVDAEVVDEESVPDVEGHHIAASDLSLDAVAQPTSRGLDRLLLSSPDLVVWHQSPLPTNSPQQRQNGASDVGTSLQSDSYWPLRDPQQALLLQHFVDKVSPFVSLQPHDISQL